MARWASTADASAHTGLSTRTLSDGRSSGRIPGSANPTGRSVVWNLDVLDAWLEAAMDTRALEPEDRSKADARNRRRRMAKQYDLRAAS